MSAVLARSTITTGERSQPDTIHRLSSLFSRHTRASDSEAPYLSVRPLLQSMQRVFLFVQRVPLLDFPGSLENQQKLKSH
ncbi:hypothetical protein [Coleofasciculus sp. H7-2]|uniref:hypothetical protein n=1 Tax=Coleofasciculus sp. H7-2 TaxID=3351545 RepID=UPI003672C6A5